MSSPTDDLHRVPTAAELVEAVREFLERDVMEATDGRVRFHNRVAINALRMVERELDLGPDQAAAHQVRLAALGYSDEAALASAIRAGELDDQYEEVKAAITETVLDRLRVANPDYAADSAGQ